MTTDKLIEKLIGHKDIVLSEPEYATQTDDKVSKTIKYSLPNILNPVLTEVQLFDSEGDLTRHEMTFKNSKGEILELSGYPLYPDPSPADFDYSFWKAFKMISEVEFEKELEAYIKEVF